MEDKINNKTIFILFLVACFFGGCAAPFSKFYVDQTGGVDITSPPYNAIYEISNGEPRVITGNMDNIDADYIRMLEDGYWRVGYSSFNAGNVNENGAITQAKKLHAFAVLIYSKYTNTVSGATPLTLPDTQTSTSTFSGSAYGSGGGYANYSGIGTTTTYGSTTTYIPYNVRRNDYYASYWIKIKSFIFGIHTNELTPEIRQKIGSNKGALIIAVVKKSPAYQADILNGDVLRKIGDIEIIDKNTSSEVVENFAGKEVQVELLRDGKAIKKIVKFNK